MLMGKRSTRSLRGFGEDSETDLAIQVQEAEKTLDELQAQNLQIETTINTNLQASASGSLNIAPVSYVTGAATTGFDFSKIIGKDATGKTKILGLDWYIPVAGIGALLLLLKS